MVFLEYHTTTLLYAWHTLSASRMVFTKHTSCAWHTLSAIIWCPWTKGVCLTHPLRKSRGVRAKDFVALLLSSFLIIECEQKGHKVTSCVNSKVVFGFLTSMNVKLRSSGMWCRVLRYIGADVSEVRCPHLQNMPICCSEQFVRNSYQCWCLFTRLHGNTSFKNVILSSVWSPIPCTGCLALTNVTHADVLKNYVYREHLI